MERANTIQRIIHSRRRPKRDRPASGPRSEHLRREGYDIRALNWRQGRYELDIVALKEGVLHFVEVKTRRAGSLTPPEAAATQRKFRALSRAAECYLRTTGWEGEVQFDLAAAEAFPDGTIRVELIENALEYNW